MCPKTANSPLRWAKKGSTPRDKAISTTTTPFRVSQSAVGIAYPIPRTRKVFDVPAFLVPTSLMSIPFNFPKRYPGFTDPRRYPKNKKDILITICQAKFPHIQKYNLIYWNYNMDYVLSYKKIE